MPEARKAVKFGLTLPNRGVLLGATTTGQLLELSERAEAGGRFDSLWVGDSLLAKPRLESITLLSAVAARTRKLKMGPACLASFPLRDPLWLAYQWASLDVLSEGRTVMVACMGGGSREAGGDFLKEFEAVGLDVRGRARRMEEGIGLLRRFWTEDHVDHEGEFFTYRDVSLQPKPVQKPCPPIWIVSNPHFFKVGEKTLSRGLERVVRLGDGWMTTLVTPEEFQDGWTRIREFSQKAGRQPDAIEPTLYYNINVNPDREAAYEESKRFLDAYYMTDFSREVLEMWVAFGPPEECIEKIRSFIEAGAQTITLRFCSWDQTGQMEVCTREVLPHLT